VGQESRTVETKIGRLAIMKFFAWCLLLLESAALSAQEGSVRIEFNSLNPAVIQHRLEMVRGKTSERREVLEDLFREAGCTEVTE